MFSSLMHGLHGLQNIFIVLIVIFLTLLLMLVIPLAIRRQFKISFSANLVKGADDAFRTLVGVTMALMAFALVQVEGLHRNVGDLVSREGAILLKFDRTIEDFGGDQAPLVKQQLRAYVASVMQSEWPAMAHGGRSNDTSAKLVSLSSSIDQLAPNTPKQHALIGEIGGQLIQVKDIREARISSSYVNLSPYFGLGIAMAMLTLTVLGWFQSPAEKAVPFVGGIALAISTMLTILIISSGIFEGESRVTPDAIGRTLAIIDSGAPAVVPDSPSASAH